MVASESTIAVIEASDQMPPMESYHLWLAGKYCILTQHGYLT